MIIRSLSRSWRILETPLDGSLAFHMEVTKMKKFNYTNITSLRRKRHNRFWNKQLWIMLGFSARLKWSSLWSHLSFRLFPPLRDDFDTVVSVSLIFRHGYFNLDHYRLLAGAGECDTGRHVKWWLCPGANNIKYTTLAATCRYSTACPTCRKHYDISVSAVYLSAFSPCLRCINNNL